jgi:twitching motility protein PilT
MKINYLLLLCAQHGASDLHLSSQARAMLRVDGALQPCTSEALTQEAIEEGMRNIMSPHQQACFEQNKECDFSFELLDVARFRVNVFMQARGISAVFRIIPCSLPTLDQLNAPAIISSLVCSPRGLILVTGPTGSGKSTTLAAMVDLLNQTSAIHVITIEDPIEFVHTPQCGLVQQRELATHTLSFSNALRAAMREDPDVILLGEMRDLETIRLAMTAAETGHLVLATLHASTAAKAVDRIIDVFPAEEKEMIRAMLSESLNAVISQVLCPRQDGRGRVAAYEVMVGTPAIRHLIRENKVAQMYSVIQTGRAMGMQTMDQSLSQLHKQGLIDAAQARAHAKHPESFF